MGAKEEIDYNFHKELKANVPEYFAKEVVRLCSQYNVELLHYSDYNNGWKTVKVKGGLQDLIDLNTECSKVYDKLNIES